MSKTIKSAIKTIPGLNKLILFSHTFFSKPNFFKKVILFKNFLLDFNKFKKHNSNKNFILSERNLKPCIYDKIENTPIDYTYFYQNTWCVKKIIENKPKSHFDVGSKIEMLGIISQFIPVTMLDIRPINLELTNLTFEKADILSLPFKDNSIESLSSICVVEHIGLGRYGDKFDPFGSEKAIKELKRALANNGSLYISLPVDSQNVIYFNAHRAFTREYILKLFYPLKLIEEKYIYKKNFIDSYQKEKGFGTGLYHFRKI